MTVADDLKRLAEALFVLNCDAIKERYGERALQEDFSCRPPFLFRIVPRDAVEVFKATNCLLYQCSEGDVPEQKLYKALDRISSQVAEQIVRATPEYDAAAWGD